MALILSCVAFISLLGVARPRRQALGERGGSGRIGLWHLHDIDPVQRGEIIEMHDVIVQTMSGEDQIADQLGVQWYLQLEASSTARTLAMACTVVQTPQKR